MKNCINCGAQLGDEMVICNACGSNQPAQANSVPNYYTQGSYTPRTRNTLGLVGFILGIASLVFVWVPFLGLGLGVGGLICSILGNKKGKPTGNTSFAVVGMILSIIGSAIGLIYSSIMIIAIAVAIMDSIF